MFSSVGRQAFRRGRKTPREHYAGVLASAALIAVVTFTSIGSVLVPKAAISLPSRPIRYLWKFHLGMLVMPSSAAAHLSSGMALGPITRSEEQTSELQSLMRISYDVYCLTKKNESK